MSNAAKNFDILATIVWAFYIIILIVQNYFSDLYPVKILDSFNEAILFIYMNIPVTYKFFYALI